MKLNRKLCLFAYMGLVFCTSVIASETVFKPITVETATAYEDKLTETVTANGVITKGVTFTQTADSDFIIEEFTVSIGDFVNEGDLIFITANDEEVVSEYTGTVCEIPIMNEVYKDQTILSLIDINTLTATVNVNETYASQIKKGQSVIVTGNGFKNTEYKGTIQSIGAQAISTTGTAVCVPVTVEFEKPDKNLKPNFTVKAKIDVSNENTAIYIPQSAIVNSGSGEYVYVVNENTANRRSVESVYNANGVCITKGLNVGEQVVLNADVFSDNTESVSVYVKAVK